MNTIPKMFSSSPPAFGHVSAPKVPFGGDAVGDVGGCRIEIARGADDFRAAAAVVRNLAKRVDVHAIVRDPHRTVVATATLWERPLNLRKNHATTARAVVVTRRAGIAARPALACLRLPPYPTKQSSPARVGMTSMYVDDHDVAGDKSTTS